MTMAAIRQAALQNLANTSRFQSQPQQSPVPDRSFNNINNNAFLASQLLQGTNEVQSPHSYQIYLGVKDDELGNIIIHPNTSTSYFHKRKRGRPPKESPKSPTRMGTFPAAPTVQREFTDTNLVPPPFIIQQPQQIQQIQQQLQQQVNSVKKQINATTAASSPLNNNNNNNTISHQHTPPKTLTTSMLFSRGSPTSQAEVVNYVNGNATKSLLSHYSPQLNANNNGNIYAMAIENHKKQKTNSPVTNNNIIITAPNINNNNNNIQQFVPPAYLTHPGIPFIANINK